MEKANSKMFTMLIIPLLLIPIFGVASAHWYDSILKQYKWHVGCVDAKVITYKILSPWDDELIKKWPPDDQMPTKSISISTKVFPGWYCWIGFLIQNQGQLPVWVSQPQFQVVDPDGAWVWFIHTEYCYAQVIDGTSYGWPRNDVPNYVYALVKLNPKAGQTGPPPLGDIPPPVYLDAAGDPGQGTRDSVVMWIKLKLSEACPIDKFNLQLTLNIAASLAIAPESIEGYSWP